MRENQKMQWQGTIIQLLKNNPQRKKISGFLEENAWYLLGTIFLMGFLLSQLLVFYDAIVFSLNTPKFTSNPLIQLIVEILNLLNVSMNDLILTLINIGFGVLIFLEIAFLISLILKGLNKESIIQKIYLGSIKPRIFPDISPPEERLFSLSKKSLDWINHIFSSSKFLILIGFLAFWVKIGYISSTDMWDEGWFTAIAVRLTEGNYSPLLPLYYIGNNVTLQFFDKPPVAFWGGAILMDIFGRTTFAAKGIVILGGTGLAIITYLLFSHQRENKSAAIVGGLLVALVHFLTFYSRTAYIDPFVAFMSALVMLIGIRAIDAVFMEDNRKKGYFLLSLTVLINTLNILTKAWQGVLTFPAIAIYLFFRYIESHIRLNELSDIIRDLRPFITLKNDISNPNALITLIFSFIISFIISGLALSSFILSLVISYGFYSIFLKFTADSKKDLNRESILVGILAGGISSFLGSFVLKIFYGRLAASILSIAQTATEQGMILIASEGPLSNQAIALILLELLSVLFGAICALMTVFIISGCLFDLLTKNDAFLRVVFSFLDIVPLGILGLWFGIWFAGILLFGLFFERDSASITLFGILVSCFLLPLVSYYPRIKNFLSTRLSLNDFYRSPEETTRFRSNLIFLTIMVLLLITSFYPFVAWVQYLDTNIANGLFPWSIRVPGELALDEQRPNPVTYTFLFFEYYISWRYTHATKYDLASSIGSAVNDFTLIIFLPFFLIGIYAFYFSDKKNPALGSLFLAWLITIPFVFFPAQFQLNYYYIPLAIPYLAVSAKGLEFIYSNETLRLTVNDAIERFLAGLMFYFHVSYQYIITPLPLLLSLITQLQTGAIDLHSFINEVDYIIGNYFFVAVILIIPFTVIAFKFSKTFPGIISTGLAYYFFIASWLNNPYKLYSTIFHDLLETIITLDYQWILVTFEHGAPVVTVIGIILLILGLYWLRSHVKPQALIILTLVLSSMLINVSALAHTNQVFDLHFQEISIYVNTHGGNYNYSTWVIPEAGAQFAMRYYLGYEVVGTGDQPFSTNSTTGMENYYRYRPNIKFWVIINDSSHWDVPAYAIKYPDAYKWFTSHEHLVCVDEIVGLTSWYKMHFYVNSTWIIEQGFDWTNLVG